jgi:hypothetical protein
VVADEDDHRSFGTCDVPQRITAVRQF